MTDASELDRKYFIDERVYNCPFCNRNNVAYRITSHGAFNWSADKVCYVYFVLCSSCNMISMHLSYEDIRDKARNVDGFNPFERDIDIDSKIFYSVPTSFFVIDSRIPERIRELIAEGEGCLKMNYLTGASACIRKAIYELLVIEAAEGDSYQDRINSLKATHPDSDPNLFNVLGHIQDMTSDKVHEQSWDKWDSSQLKLITETLKAVLYDIYVVPQIKKERSLRIQQLQERLKKDKKPSVE